MVVTLNVPWAPLAAARGPASVTWNCALWHSLQVTGLAKVPVRWMVWAPVSGLGSPPGAAGRASQASRPRRRNTERKKMALERMVPPDRRFPETTMAGTNSKQSREAA